MHARRSGVTLLDSGTYRNLLCSAVAASGDAAACCRDQWRRSALSRVILGVECTRITSLRLAASARRLTLESRT